MRVAILIGAAVAGVLAFAPAAPADVTITPATAVRGDAAKVTFELPTERAGAYTTAVQVDVPPETPIAEVFPMSVPEWAPKVSYRRLDRPIEAIHGTRTDEVVSTITWRRVAPPPTGPGEVVRLPVSVGPLPDTERIAFPVVQTYSDGTVVRWDGRAGKPAAVLTLVPAPPPDGAAGPGDGPVAGEDATAAPAESGGAPLLGAGLAVGLGLAVGGWFIARARRPAGAPAESAGGAPRTGSGAEPSTAEPAPSRWRLREPDPPR